MPNLREIGDALVADPLVARPPLDAVTARGQRFLVRRRRRRLTTLAVIPLVAFTGLITQQGTDGDRVHVTDTPTTTTTMTTSTAPDRKSPTRARDDGEQRPRPGGGGTTSGSAESRTTTTTTRPAGATGSMGAPANTCPEGRNAGVTDVGVTHNSVTIHVNNGDGSASGVKEVINRVNGQGGVCGRRIEIETTLHSEIPFKVGEPPPYPPAGEYFAVITGAHDSEFLAALHEGEVDKAATPVVGTDGINAVEYESGWTFPVGSSVASQTRIMTMDAYDRGARRLAIVFESGGEFEQRAKPAFDTLVRDLPGAAVAVSIAVDPDSDVYHEQIRQFNDACEGTCDFVVLALQNTTATKWIKGGAMPPNVLRTGATSVLANQDFGAACGESCSGLVVWSPFVIDNPQLLPHWRGKAAGEVLVAALRSVGSDLTRQRLRDALTNDAYLTSVTPPLRWGTAVPEGRFANVSARPYLVTYKGGYDGLREGEGGWRRDPRPSRLPA